ncbi:acyl-CoA dehydrogenase/oxidase, partial [Tribonema minus]
SEDELMIQDMVARFSNDVIKPRVRDMDDASKMDPAVLSGLFENGLMSVEVPTEHGGSGLGFVSACLVIEEIAKVDPAVAVLVDIQATNTLLNNMLRFWGTPEQQAKYFPLLGHGTVASFCLSEPGSGSDAFALATTATRSADGSYYTIEGAKSWISNAEQAGVFFVFATVDRGAGYRGITCFIVDKEVSNGGISVGRKEDKLGIRASSTCPVTFHDCKVPAENVLGQVGQGYKYAIQILNEGRIGIGAQMVGLSLGCFEHVMPYLFERKQFGTHIGDFQAVQHQYAQMATDIEAARQLTYATARMKASAGLPFVKQAAMTKLFTSQVATRTASQCLQLLGGVGYTKAYLAEKYYRDCMIGTIYEGTSNIQLNTIARLIKEEF